MDNNKIMIVGTGNVGASIAFALLHQRTAVNEIILTDIIAKDAEGEAVGRYLTEHGCIYKRYEKLGQSFDARHDHYA